LREGLAFYAEVEARSGAADAAALDALFGSAKGAADLCGGDAGLWQRCQAAHRGHQLGLSLLLIAPRLGHRAGFFEVTVGADLSPVFPARFLDPAQMAVGGAGACAAAGFRRRNCRAFGRHLLCPGSAAFAAAH